MKKVRVNENYAFQMHETHGFLFTGTNPPCPTDIFDAFAENKKYLEEACYDNFNGTYNMYDEEEIRQEDRFADLTDILDAYEDTVPFLGEYTKKEYAILEEVLKPYIKS